MPINHANVWIPAFAGMTWKGKFKCVTSINEILSAQIFFTKTVIMSDFNLITDIIK
jgi:hypothetical protein